jgi:transposase-like protein
MMAERGIDIAHPTSMRWGQRYVPEFEKGGSGMLDRSARPGAAVMAMMRFSAVPGAAMRWSSA